MTLREDFGKHWTAATYMAEVYWWGILIIWEHGEDFLKQIIETLNAFHPTNKFNVEWSKKEINVLDVNVGLKIRQLETDLDIKQTDNHHFLNQHLATLTTLIKV